MCKNWGIKQNDDLGAEPGSESESDSVSAE